MHVLVNNDIEFIRLPFQPYEAVNGNKVATVSQGRDLWTVTIRETYLSGKSKMIDSKIFEKKDEAFIWAYLQIKDYEEVGNEPSN